jgi:hypothetical protein
MNNRNNYKLGGLAVAVAALAIGAGATVSGNAMASSEAAETATDLVSIVSLGADGVGEAIACSFDGVDLPTLVANAGAGLDANAAEITAGIAVVDSTDSPTEMSFEGADPAAGSSFAVTADGVVIEGEMLPVDAELGELIDDGQANAGAISEVLPTDGVPGGMEPISADDVRQGTADECAEILGGLTNAP